ncbi:MAG: DUF86 domain-containing protein [Prevotella sp.]|jgi:uncharacterized protein with HEPN domain|nr:DUF86 domain-containing protein [Prevotella sp.]
MEFTSLEKRNRIKYTLEQINTAINQLKEWNEDVKNADDFYLSSSGMQKLAANSMLIEAIGEGIRQIDEHSDGKLLPERSDIPWKDIIGMRNRIAHGYFEVDAELVLATIKNDLDPLQDAIQYFLETI